MKNYLQRVVYNYYRSSGDASYDWAGRLVAEHRFRRLLDVGCGDGSRLFNYFQERPERFCGVEGHPELAAKARARGLEVTAFDLNCRWPYPDASFDGIHATQVIEHVHNTRLFLVEALRVLAPGGAAIITSENLCSFLNLAAMALGYTPFSLQCTCGWYVGNPFGMHHNEDIAVDTAHIPLEDPAYSGIFGHNRVLSVPQAADLMTKVGFVDVKVSSVGLMPIPALLGRPLEPYLPRRGHFLLMYGRKAKV